MVVEIDDWPPTTARTPRERAPSQTPSATRREARKNVTQAKYQSWQNEYRSLKKTRPGESDSWYALKISRMDIGKGSSSETIRKHMKRK